MGANELDRQNNWVIQDVTDNALWWQHCISSFWNLHPTVCDFVKINDENEIVATYSNRRINWQTANKTA